MQENNSVVDPLELFTTEELAKQFKMSTAWLRMNRRQDNKIPFRKFGRLIRYQRSDLTDWLGEKELELLTTEETANLFKFSVAWLNHNRCFDDEPVPYRKIGGLIRYHRNDVKKWLRKQEKVQ